MEEFNRYNSNSQRMHILTIAQVSISLLVCNVDQTPFMVITVQLANVGNHHATRVCIKGLSVSMWWHTHGIVPCP